MDCYAGAELAPAVELKLRIDAAASQLSDPVFVSTLKADAREALSGQLKAPVRIAGLSAGSIVVTAQLLGAAGDMALLVRCCPPRAARSAAGAAAPPPADRAASARRRLACISSTLLQIQDHAAC